MGYKIGIVKATEPGGYAQVMTERKNVCEACHHSKLVCYGCLLNPKVIGRVANPVGARVGDTVKIHISARKLNTAAGMFYLLPVFTLMLGILSGIYISKVLGISETTTAIGCSFAGLAIGIVFVTVLGRAPKISKMIEPVITSIVRSMESGPG